MPEELILPEKERKKVIKRIEEKHDELRELLEDLKKEMEMINKARAIVRAEKMSFITPKKNVKFLEEIKVPALKILKDKESKS
jgi:esterase/lipase